MTEQKYYTNEDVRQAMHALLNYEPPRPMIVAAEAKGAARFVLDVVAPAIAARALREEASRLRQMAAHGADGEADPYETSDYLDRRADEIEAAS